MFPMMARLSVMHLLLAVIVTPMGPSYILPVHACQPAVQQVSLDQDTVANQPRRPPSPVHQPANMFPVDPFEVSGATMLGPVDSRLQVQLLDSDNTAAAAAAGDGTGGSGGRSLLHGSKKRKKYPKCRKCRMVSCNAQRSFCSGHCRKSGKLFSCSSKTRPDPRCQFSDYRDPTVEDYEGEPPGELDDYDTAVVEAPAPYIGCANIRGRPSGCPARGTLAEVPDRGEAKVLFSRCRVEYYIPGCLAPLLPFGVCECILRITKRVPGERSIVWVPCSSAELEAGLGVEGGEEPEEELAVVLGDGITQTYYSNFTTPGQEPDFTYNVTTEPRNSDAVFVEMSFYKGLVSLRAEVEEGTEVRGDGGDYEEVDEYYEFSPL
eukprot:jgi/Ulvmu1/2086/UM123_0018.1